MKKICLYCRTQYTKNLSRKADYGYCSLDCMTSDKSACPGCGQKITKHPHEKWTEFSERHYCSQKCGASHHASQPRSETHRKNLSISRRRFNQTPRGQAILKSIARRSKKWIKTPKGKQSILDSRTAHQKWRRSPRGRAWQARMNELRRTPEYREKLRGALRNFHDSPRGYALAAKRTLKKSLPDAPYGPNWERQRSAVIKRDEATCQICKDHGVDVHHVISRRKFWYIPGQNTNFIWANNPDNLVTLCKACHTRVERKKVSVPKRFWSRAQSHYKMFKKDCVKT